MPLFLSTKIKYSGTENANKHTCTIVILSLNWISLHPHIPLGFCELPNGVVYFHIKRP